MTANKKQEELYRTRAVLHKCLPHLAYINPTPLLFLKIANDSKNDFEIWKKASH